ncbi:P-loop containing nucleoside triphosphate hydrolases superfamily protein [Striga hermonthica]|uniref:P-loop containing nucleoside triphosphate hydrolases superfamily protein n=1 Tax=Striga hermonthica TaxID=68872 RepID=A0A9N7MQX2_STRHE|nr:P-loop containing nucleoside triphosphate hydrolases superfamily protein [Striga hermonthica]
MVFPLVVLLLSLSAVVAEPRLYSAISIGESAVDTGYGSCPAFPSERAFAVADPDAPPADYILPLRFPFVAEPRPYSAFSIGESVGFTGYGSCPAFPSERAVAVADANAPPPDYSLLLTFPSVESSTCPVATNLLAAVFSDISSGFEVCTAVEASAGGKLMPKLPPVPNAAKCAAVGLGIAVGQYVLNKHTRATIQSHWMLVIHWPPTCCASRSDCFIPIPERFTIHGLWPINQKGDTMSPNKPFNAVSQLNGGDIIDWGTLRLTERRLDREWPNLVGSDDFFWNWEWTRHGYFLGLSALDYFRKALDYKSAVDAMSGGSMEKFLAKRRDTWCPGNLARKNLKELSPVVEEHLSEVKSARTDQRAVGPLLPFEELVKEESTNECSKQDEDCKRSALEDPSLPDPHALLHVTRERWLCRARIMSDIQIDQLMRKLEVADQKCKECAAQNTDSLTHKDGKGCLRDSDAILVINQLQEKIVLEMEKCSSQKQLKSVVDLATEQTISAQEKYEKVHRFNIYMSFCSEFFSRNLLSLTIFHEESNWLISLLTEAEEIKLEFEKSRHIIWSLSSVVEELRSFLSLTPDLIHDLRPSVSQSLARYHNEAQSCLRNKVSELEDEKLVLINQASDLHSRIEELNSEVRESRNAFMELNEKQEAEKTELQCQLQMLQMEISFLSTCALAKEKENIKKELEKAKSKLKDTEFKLKNAVQEKTKLEGEKACAERERKKVQCQKARLRLSVT